MNIDLFFSNHRDDGVIQRIEIIQNGNGLFSYRRVLISDLGDSEDWGEEEFKNNCTRAQITGLVAEQIITPDTGDQDELADDYAN